MAALADKDATDKWGRLEWDSLLRGCLRVKVVVRCTIIKTKKKEKKQTSSKGVTKTASMYDMWV